ncbi:NACHT domain-containing protein [Marinobacter nauticus]|uniref:NACHT domain-containing protein n=1 Tax=Marinobacter nauticus TaxID=2743 RepID=UPI004044A453
MELLTAASIIAGTESVKSIINEIHQSSKLALKQLKITRINKQAEETIYRKLQSVENVKTIWKVDEEVNLNEFYYPSKISIPGVKSKITPKFISEITTSKNIVIEGTAGQGKSILLRYLASNEIKKGEKIPLFIELRKIAHFKSLTRAISEKLDALGFESSNSVVDQLLKAGKLTILLDGFDEISSQEKSIILSNLEDLITRYQKTVFVVTSRPGSGIQNSEFFRVVKICKLDRDDHWKFLERVCSSTQQANSIDSAIGSSTLEIQGLITTPLLLTLLTILYKSDQVIPDNLIEFYNKLFYILFTKHDNSKPGFKREILSQLRETRFEELFEHFCFLTRRRQKTLFAIEIAKKFIKESIELSKIETDESAFLADCCNVTCLLIEEGTDFQFIHKSVQEFYSAKFISKRNESIAEKFYGQCLTQFISWEQELKFLEDLDGYRYNKFFLIPALEMLEEIARSENGHRELLKGSTMIFDEKSIPLQITPVNTKNLVQYLRDEIIDIIVENREIGVPESLPFLEVGLLKTISIDNDKHSKSSELLNGIYITETYRALELKKCAIKTFKKEILKIIENKRKKAQAFVKNEENLEARIFSL